MRVAHLATVDLSLRYLVLPQLRAVVDLGGEAVGISADGPYVKEIESLGIRHIVLPGATRSVDPRADLEAMISLWRILRRERPDVIHTHTPKPGLYGRIIGRLAGVPAVLNTVHGLYATPDDRPAKRTIVYALEALAARFSDAELIQSAEDYELLIERRITRPDRTVLLGNGVDLERFAPVPIEERLSVRHALGIADDRIVVGMVGRLVAEKGYNELFEAARDLGDRCTVVVIGPHEPDKDDGLDPAVVARAEQEGVRFLGMRSDVDALYRAMDIFVLPSHREGFPRAAMEAAATGIPVVATDIRGCREVVDPGVNGLLVAVRDAAALAAGINRLSEDAEMRAAMGVAGRAKAERDFDERKVVHTVVAAQVRALREKGRFERFDGPSPVGIRRAEPRDARLLARMHADGIDTGFLARLGVGFLEQLYRQMLASADSVVLVAEDGYAPVGFVAGTANVDALYREFARDRGFRAALSASFRLARPSTIRRAWETWRYDGDHLDTSAELLSMAVAEPFRGLGIGKTLGVSFLEEMEARGAERVKVVVGEDNRGALAAYRSMGFAEKGMIEVHAGERSVAMLWSRAPVASAVSRPQDS